MPPDFRPLILSLEVAAGALAMAFPLGIGAALWLRDRERNGVVEYRFRGQILLESLFLLPLVLPPVVTGLFLLLLLGKRGAIGQFLLGFGFQILFSPLAATLAAAIVAFPLVFQSARGALSGVDSHLEDAARGLGATPFRALWSVTLPLCAPGLWAGAVLAFARALGEFGATVMVAGNVAGKSLTAPVALYFAAENGEYSIAAQYAFWLGIANFAFLLLAGALTRRRLSR